MIVATSMIFFLWGVWPYAIAILMPSWRVLLGYAIILGGLFGYFWIDYWLESHGPGFNLHAGGVISLGLIGAATLGFVTGVAARSVTLLAAKLGRPRAVILLSVHILAFPFAAAIVAAPGLWHEWKYRPVSASCSGAIFEVRIGGNRLALPVAPFLTVYQRSSPPYDAYYFRNPSTLRAFCAISENGKRPVRVAVAEVSLQNAWMSDSYCTKHAEGWAKRPCAAIAARNHDHFNTTNFPNRLDVFSSAEKPRGFSIGGSTYDEWRGRSPPIVPGTSYATTDFKTETGTPLTFACAPLGTSGRQWCATTYRWRDDASIHYDFTATPQTIVKTGLQVDATVKAFLDERTIHPR